MTYSFIYINNHGNGTVADVKDFSTDKAAIEDTINYKEHGFE